MTCVEGAAHNVYALSLADGTWRRLTDNNFQGVSFGGVDASLPGSLIYARQVKNQDLWVKLSAQAERHEVSWHWVKGHAGHPENERADELANIGLDTLLQSSR